MYNIYTQQLLGKSLIGKLFFLNNNNNFQNIIQSRLTYYYKETFKISDNLVGRFECNILNNKFKQRSLWSFNNNLVIYDTFKRSSLHILLEDLKIIKKTFRFNEIPEINHKLLYQTKPTNINDVPYSIYEKILKKSDKDIIEFSNK